MIKIVLVVFILVFSGNCSELSLHRLLLSSYDKTVRPALHHNTSLSVVFGLALTQIIDVDERNQVLTTNCWLSLQWQDSHLTWNSTAEENITVIRLPAETIWKPDIILYNNADRQYNSGVTSTNAIVASDGNITWLSSAIFKSSCAINVEFFPFDEQKCSMKFASWTYDGFQVNLINSGDTTDLSNYVTNGEWDLVAAEVERNVVYYSCCQEPYPDVTYHLVLRRRPLFYVFNLILPCVLITGIALMSFYMPSDSGEKVTLGITTLLSMTVFLMVIGESMPPTSEKLPLIGLYYGVTISLVSFATGLSVVTLNLHHRGMRGRRIPPLLRYLVYHVLAKILMIRLKHDTNSQLDTKQAADLPISSSSSSHQCGICHPQLLPAAIKGWTDRASLETLLGLSVIHCSVGRLVDRLHVALDSHERRLVDQERREEICMEWKHCALVIDRFLLWIFICATISATFGILYMSPHTKLFTL